MKCVVTTTVTPAADKLCFLNSEEPRPGAANATRYQSVFLPRSEAYPSPIVHLYDSKASPVEKNDGLLLFPGTLGNSGE